MSNGDDLVNLRVASDYAVLTAGHLEFYYGYEVTASGAPGFQVTHKGKVIISQFWTILGIPPGEEWECAKGLLRGIGWAIESGRIPMRPLYGPTNFKPY